jgi:hypothetical protein
MERMANEKIKEIIAVKEIVVEETQKRQLIWYVSCKDNGKRAVTQSNARMCAPRKKETGRPNTSWIDNVGRAVSERSLQDEQCQDRVRWSKGLVTGQRRQTL